ncbi:endonuclease/exonuclease/phosphatase family protein [Kribbella albertanoniae]|uniref:Endonuclease/exonuclease/phosphatase n=1 Tax=Kribbella albertanoniae TaxID=1266829 RepID=A0A4R4QEE4_9ACTN|nr:endonuclease/exonuclease/phosphatase family protein [Kribbella albertanoniae]TDC33513.1 endonuclease/exonuclease/phosphatase [Kribbella albertanoniae]
MIVASLNTRGMPLRGSRLGERYAAIGAVFEASDVDVVNFQEVLTYYHLRQLVRAMPSYRFASYRRSAAGPAGGLLTLSRTPIARTGYRRFPMPVAADAAGLPRLSRLKASLKGVLLTSLPGVTVANTHLLANFDGDWSETNRYYRLHQGQLAALGRTVASIDVPVILSGDFNIARDSSLYGDFIRDTGLVDAFGADCPPTFHASYLHSNQTAHCIDFLLLSDPSITIEAAQLTFTEQLPMPGGPDYLTDHLGLQVSLAL